MTVDLNTAGTGATESVPETASSSSPSVSQQPVSYFK